MYIYFATMRNTLKWARVARCRGVVVLNANEVLIRGDRQICKCLDVREGRSALKTSAVMRTGRGRTGPASGEPNRTEQSVRPQTPAGRKHGKHVCVCVCDAVPVGIGSAVCSIYDFTFSSHLRGRRTHMCCLRPTMLQRITWQICIEQNR